MADAPIEPPSGAAPKTDTPPKSPNAKTLNLALQGGGAHGAFTWGVLDRFLEEPDLAIEGISGTSAGAMNAVVLADGYERGGAKGAREALAEFWDAVGRIGLLSPFHRSPMDVYMRNWAIGYQPMFMLMDFLTRIFSPYQLNPLNLNPLRQQLLRQVDFARVRDCPDIKVFVSATSVWTGQARVFSTREITPEAVMASACLPLMFQAVEIDGEPFWDGGYMGNPVLYPLIYNCESRDLLLVQINPIRREVTPRSATEIVDRMNEITFNSSLIAEMRAIAFVAKLVEDGKLDPNEYKKMLIHRVDGAATLDALGAQTKLVADTDFLLYLRDAGRAAAAAWINRHWEQVGVESTVHVGQEFLTK